ncbi:TIGR00289 family protein [Methanosarcina sp. DH2]|jgi:ABC transporter with metal-binding/Fe-S-binding domain ATP-binding protein|uniref:diphthine--ammonia ligase n=1 Tax=Methanosarcina sp. DH2 TaxID=2605639 RepID=UPI001E4A6FB2|nr:diphthine--ammonia ligase [Methanosarcina sp. DH2]MCC4770026.1 TIGR00289 family protein [Methanosarcina sp. DH2]
MKLAALISGGKDSVFAIHKALEEGHEVTHLINIIPARDDSYMYHSINLHMVELISAASEIPLIQQQSSGIKELELDDLTLALKKVDVDGVSVGAIESQYQASRVQKICDSLGLKMYAPLWHRDPEELLNEMAKVLDIRIVKVAADGLDQSWLGRPINVNSIENLKALNRRYMVHMAGEGGEYETVVLDAPFFKKRIEIVKSEVEWEGDIGSLKILDARLVEKT